MNAGISEKIDEYIKVLPSLPTSVLKVMEICNSSQTSPADLNQVISLDPVLSGRVLKLINSAYYCMGSPVTSLIRAIIMLGINTVKNLVLSTTIMGSLSSKKHYEGLDMEDFWRHSICVGAASKYIAKKRGIDPKLEEEYFTVGLLHDIGKIPLNAVFTKDYSDTLSTANSESTPLYRLEEKNLGLDHCASGAAIVKAWKLEGPVGDAIACHHHPGEYNGRYDDLLFSTIAANNFANIMRMGFAGDLHPDTIDKRVWDTLGMGPDVYAELKPLVNGEIEKAEIFLKI